VNPLNNTLFLVFLVTVTIDSVAQASRDLTIIEKRFGEKLWTMQYSSKSKQECELKLVKQIAKLNPFECQKLEKLMGELKTEKPNSVQASEVPIDASVYEIKFDKISTRSLLQAPKTCQIQNEGQLKCKDVTLTIVQKVVLELLFFKEEKFK